MIREPAFARRIRTLACRFPAHRSDHLNQAARCPVFRLCLRARHGPTTGSAPAGMCSAGVSPVLAVAPSAFLPVPVQVSSVTSFEELAYPEVYDVEKARRIFAGMLQVPFPAPSRPREHHQALVGCCRNSRSWQQRRPCFRPRLRRRRRRRRWWPRAPRQLL